MRISTRWFIGVALAICSMVSHSALAGQTVLYYFSEPGDYIGGGQEATLTPTAGTFTVRPNYSNSIQVMFNAPVSPWWTLSFSAANGQIVLPGNYEDSQRFPFQGPGHPGLDFSGGGRGCNTSSGRFDVLELVKDSSGNILQLAINFEQHCEGGVPALYGQVRYNSDVPLSPKPLHITLSNSLNTRGCVEATSGNGALLQLNANDALDAEGGRQLTYEWTSSTGSSGNAASFAVQAPLSTTPVSIALSVIDLTNNTTRTSTKVVCVSDTTPPVITILRPVWGAVVDAGNVVLDVKISDAADKNITSYEVDLGTHVVSPINPRTGRSIQLIQEAPKTDGPVPVTITVRARDGSGNMGAASVQFSEVFNRGRRD